MPVPEGCASPKAPAPHVPQCLVCNWAESQHLLSWIVSSVAGQLSHLLASLPVRTRAQLPMLCSLRAILGVSVWLTFTRKSAVCAPYMESEIPFSPLDVYVQLSEPLPQLSSDSSTVTAHQRGLFHGPHVSRGICCTPSLQSPGLVTPGPLAATVSQHHQIQKWINHTKQINHVPTSLCKEAFYFTWFKYSAVKTER